MSKQKKQKKDQNTASAEDQKAYQSRYFKSVEWLDFDPEYGYLVKYNDDTIFANVLATLVFSNANLSNEYSDMVLQDGYNVKYSNDKFHENCFYEMTNVFAKIWIDNLVQSVSDSLYYMTYRKQTGEHGDARRAYKYCDDLEKKFLDLVK